MSGKLLDGSEVKIEDAYDNGVYDLGVLERMHDIEVLTETIKQDNKLLSSYMDDNLSAQKMNFGIAGLLSGITEQLEDIKRRLSSEYSTWADLGGALLSTAASSFNAGQAGVMEKLMAIVDPLVESVTMLQDSILNKMQIPDLPIIGSIQDILKEIANIGRVVSKVDPQLREEARNRAKKEKEEANKNKGWFASVYEDSWLEAIVNEIVEIIRQVILLIKDIISLIQPFLLMMLLDILKPVIEAFGLVIGEIYGICASVVELGKMLIYNQAKLLDMFAQAIIEKISEIWDIFRYVMYGGALPKDAMISALAGDIVSCNFEISAKQLEINLIKSNQKEYELLNAIEEMEEDGNNFKISELEEDLKNQKQKTMLADTDIQVFQILEDPSYDFAKQKMLSEKLPALQTSPVPVQESNNPDNASPPMSPKVEQKFEPPIDVQLRNNPNLVLVKKYNSSGMMISPILKTKNDDSPGTPISRYGYRYQARKEGNKLIISFVYSDGNGNRDVLQVYPTPDPRISD